MARSVPKFYGDLAKKYFSYDEHFNVIAVEEDGLYPKQTVF